VPSTQAPSIAPATAAGPVPAWWRLGARVRGVATFAGFLGIVAGLLGLVVAPGLPDAILLLLTAGGFVLLVTGLGLTFFPGAPPIAPRRIAPPVAGRWSAANSPADRVPSHGTHGHGQSFGIDLVYEPEPGARPRFGEGRGFRKPTEFPAFGQEILAPADGRVVRVRDGARDHLTRSTWPAVAYMLLEACGREAGGSRHVLGNFVVLDLGDGAYAALAHLQRGSIAVRAGERVRSGQPLARCGNSGNSSEPHLHLQLMDDPRPLIAAGLPFAFPGDHVPANDEILEAGHER
jgi:Peptidase family M23